MQGSLSEFLLQLQEQITAKFTIIIIIIIIIEYL